MTTTMQLLSSSSSNDESSLPVGLPVRAIVVQSTVNADPDITPQQEVETTKTISEVTTHLGPQDVPREDVILPAVPTTTTTTTTSFLQTDSVVVCAQLLFAADNVKVNYISLPTFRGDCFPSTKTDSTASFAAQTTLSVVPCVRSVTSSAA